MIQCHFGYVVNSQQTVLHENRQLSILSQSVAANQANLADAQQFVRAEQGDVLGCHQTIECPQSEENLAYQHVSTSQIGSAFSEQVS